MTDHGEALMERLRKRKKLRGLSEFDCEYIIEDLEASLEYAMQHLNEEQFSKLYDTVVDLYDVDYNLSMTVAEEAIQDIQEIGEKNFYELVAVAEQYADSLEISSAILGHGKKILTVLGIDTVIEAAEYDQLEAYSKEIYNLSTAGFCAQQIESVYDLTNQADLDLERVLDPIVCAANRSNAKTVLSALTTYANFVPKSSIAFDMYTTNEGLFETYIDFISNTDTSKCEKYLEVIDGAAQLGIANRLIDDFY